MILLSYVWLQIHNFLFTFSKIYGLLDAAQTCSCFRFAVTKVVFQRIIYISLLLLIIQTQQHVTPQKRENISLSLKGLVATQNKSAANKGL
jgi:hypothetical protein